MKIWLRKTFRKSEKLCKHPQHCNCRYCAFYRSEMRNSEHIVLENIASLLSGSWQRTWKYIQTRRICNKIHWTTCTPRGRYGCACRCAWVLYRCTHEFAGSCIAPGCCRWQRRAALSCSQLHCCHYSRWFWDYHQAFQIRLHQLWRMKFPE